MTIAHTFAYHKPESLDEALALLGGPEGAARVLAGGTDLVAWLRDGVMAPEALVDIKGIQGLDRLERRGESLWIGALVTFNQVIEFLDARTWPLLAEMAAVVASNGVRNRATIAGNICAAVASCDSGPVLLVYEATVHVVGPGGARVVPMASWFKGNRKTALAPGEIVTGIEIPPVPDFHGGCFAKLRRYQGEDLAQASLAILVTRAGSVRVALGAVGPTPVRAARIEAALSGRATDPDAVAEAIALLPAESSPISDVRATREYRQYMLGVLLERGLEAACSRLAGSGPPYGTEVL